jgi:CubicO group peptidase (beta-lactamase class C family)
MHRTPPAAELGGTRVEHGPGPGGRQARIQALACAAWLLGGAVAAAIPIDPTLSSPGFFPADSTVRAILAERVDAGVSPGIVVGLLDADGTTRVLSAGRSDGPGGRPLDGDTVFEIGSITKVFTGVLLAEMAVRGDVRLDQPVAELLPKSVSVPARGDSVITLLHLATHRSGLPRLPSNMTRKDMRNPYVDYTADSLHAFLSRHALTRPPGERYEYSNLGAGLLGHALASRARKPYETLLTERVLKPLGMDDTRVTLTPAMKERLAAGHDAAGAIVPNWGFTALAGAGALRSTANDLLRFLAANLDSNATPVNAALRLSHMPRFTGGGPTVHLGLGWHRLSGSGAEILMHNGGTGGYHSFIGYDPAMRVGVVVLSNSAGDVDDIGRHLLDRRSPLKKVVKRSEARVDSTRLKGLVGRYALAPTFVLTVTREGDALFVQATGQARLRAYAESDSTFFLREVDAQFSFTRDSTGRASRIVLHQNGRSTPGNRVP